MRVLVLSLCLALLAPPTGAQDKAGIERQYRAWLQDTIWPAARRKGVSRQTFEAALEGAALNWALPDLVAPGTAPRLEDSQRQAEFGAPARYFARGTLDGTTRAGRQMAQRHAAALARAEARTGVPGHVVLAIWGRESAYGRAEIAHDAFEVLATKGFMSTRAAYFTEELIAALQIVQAGHAPGGAAGLKSSWAGALGQPQFMPSRYLAFAVDGDGDGRADIWGSEADTIASIANYLQSFGWQPGRDWGFEVRVPEAVPCTLEGPDQGRTIAQWAAMGVTRVSGRAFPAHEARGQGFLMMPAGRGGPAFIVTPNFEVLKEYNRSDLYALFVGHVGDRIAYGLGDFAAPWAQMAAMTRADIAEAQRALVLRGHDVGGVDGLPGFRTRRAIGRWQQAQGLAPTCFPDPDLLRALQR